MTSTPLKLLLPLNRVSCSADCPAKVLNLFSPNQISSQSAVSSASSFSPSHNSKWAGPKRAQQHQRNLSPRLKWLCGSSRGDEDMNSWRNSVDHETCMFGSDEETLSQVPTQAQSLVEGSGSLLVAEKNRIPDLDYLQELLAIQQQGPRAIGFFGTRNMGFMHQQLIEILSYAMVITQNHIYTSGASGTNAAVIRGALRAEKPELLTVILPQSLKMQSTESQELLAKVKNLIEKPYNDHLPLIEASRFDG